MNSSLVVDWCSYKAAKHAVENWHYSGVLPFGKCLRIGVWESNSFVGCVLFSYGANKHIGRPYDLDQFQVCELTRIAMKEHDVFVSQVISQSLRILKKQSPGIRLVVSYADRDHDHLGKIYQASNWIYVGLMNEGTRGAFIVKGKKMHPRTVAQKGVKQTLSAVRKYLDPEAEYFITTGKFKYLYPLDKAMRRHIMKLAQPYPKAEEVSKVICSTSS